MTELLEGHYSDGRVRFSIDACDDHGRKVEVDWADLFDLILDKLGGSPCDVDEEASLLTEVERLRSWKAEAMLVLGEWETVWLAVGQPGPLGSSKAASVRRFVEDMIGGEAP